MIAPRQPEGAPVTELLSELKDACQRASSTSDDETIALGESTWIRGLPAHAENGTVALSMGRDATIVIREGDIHAVSKDGDHYLVQVSSQAHVLLRIEIGPVQCLLCTEVAIDNGKQSVLVRICLPVPCDRDF